MGRYNEKFTQESDHRLKRSLRNQASISTAHLVGNKGSHIEINSTSIHKCFVLRTPPRIRFHRGVPKRWLRSRESAAAKRADTSNNSFWLALLDSPASTYSDHTQTPLKSKVQLHWGHPWISSRITSKIPLSASTRTLKRAQLLDWVVGYCIKKSHRNHGHQR